MCWLLEEAFFGHPNKRGFSYDPISHPSVSDSLLSGADLAIGSLNYSLPFLFSISLYVLREPGFDLAEVSTQHTSRGSEIAANCIVPKTKTSYSSTFLASSPRARTTRPSGWTTQTSLSRRTLIWFPQSEFWIPTAHSVLLLFSRDFPNP